MSSVPKVVRAAQKAAFNQYMTRESVRETNHQSLHEKFEHQPKKLQNVRLHDETIHLKFGFPNLKKPQHS